MDHEKVNPMTVTDSNSGKKYTLEFSRESVKFAEARGFDIDKVDSFPMTLIPDFFFYAFRMHHKNVARTETDRLFNELGGLTKSQYARLGQLYSIPMQTLTRDEDDEEAVKNASVTVEL